MNRFALSAFTGLVAELERPFRIHPMDDWVNLLLAVGNPAVPILTYPEAFEGEYGHACQMRMESDCLIEVKVPNIGFPVKLFGTPQQVHRHPTLLGEQTAEVLTELGLSQGEQAELEAQGTFPA